LVVATSDAPAKQPCLSHTQRSSLAQIEFRALYHGSPLQTTPIASENRSVGTAFHFERRVCGLRTGICDGVVLLFPGVASAEDPLRLDALTGIFGDLDVATIRIVGRKLPIELTGASQANRKKTNATAEPSTVQEVMPLESTYVDFLHRLGRHTRRDILKYRRQAEIKDLKFSTSNSIDLL
jgi:hypothetical protein